LKGVAECIAWILKLDPSEVPDPGGPDPWSLWRGWLGGRGLGLVPIENPREFSWGGPWIAIAKDKDSNEGRAAVAFGPPPDIIWAPTEPPPPFTAVVSGYLIAPADVTTWTPKPREITRTSGTVELIVMAAHKEDPVEKVEQAEAIAGKGLAGDRYADGAGTFSNHYGLGHELTLFEAEQAEAIGFPATEARRNIVTRGVDLNALVGETFAIGDAECIGRRLCEPCAHLQRLTEPGILRKLVHKGGLRADILKSGRIAVGDSVRGFSDHPTRI
jgi:MOSC domain-containing protein YiiM